MIFLTMMFSFVYLFSESFYFAIVAGKDFEGDKEFYSNEEWQERVEKWKVRQEKKGLISKEDGNDQVEDEDYL